MCSEYGGLGECGKSRECDKSRKCGKSREMISSEGGAELRRKVGRTRSCMARRTEQVDRVTAVNLVKCRNITAQALRASDKSSIATSLCPKNVTHETVSRHAAV
ncbi:hypothetical protein J6590_035428 [Homalodisca vitripennis]|nr:hypothetical protein J6590_035428 [Homalodisca vitripennis]